VFWPLKSNSKILGISANSQVPISRVWESSSHSSKVGLQQTILHSPKKNCHSDFQKRWVQCVFTQLHYMTKKIKQKEQAWHKYFINYKLKHTKLNIFMNNNYLISNSCLENLKVRMNLSSFCFLFVYVSSLFIWFVAWSQWKLNMVGFLLYFFNICRFAI
jgi:hypothetical protein